MAIIDRIKFDGRINAPHWLVYKCPSEQFVLGSQLIVSQGQEALFLKGGEIFDLFGPGSHTLSTGNLPLLNRWVNLPFGGKTPFTAEIYYINKTVKLDLHWGTSTAITLEDPKYGLILNVGAYGQYGITINDSRLFLSRIVGAVPNGVTGDYTVILKYFNGLINAKIKSVTSEYMIKKQISFLEISSYLSELSDVFKNAISDEFDRFGVEIVNFFCETIAPRPEDYEKLRHYKEELALSEGFYQRRRSLNILERSTTNSSTEEIANNSDEQLNCPKCGAQNNASMKFCGCCGNKLVATVICSYCGKEVPDGMKFCGNCGKSLSESKCPSCGFENEPEMKFCGNCGKKL